MLSLTWKSTTSRNGIFFPKTRLVPPGLYCLWGSQTFTYLHPQNTLTCTLGVSTKDLQMSGKHHRWTIKPKGTVKIFPKWAGSWLLKGVSWKNNQLTIYTPYGQLPLQLEPSNQKTLHKTCPWLKWSMSPSQPDCIRISLNSLARAVTNDRLSLDIVLVGQGKVYVITNLSCCIWINALSQMQSQYKEKATWLSKIDLDDLWAMFTQISLNFVRWKFLFQTLILKRIF